MKSGHGALALVVVVASGLLLAGCGQSDEQVVAGTCSAPSEELSVTCEGKDGDMACAVTCSGAEGTAECTVTCAGAEGEKTCTVTCDGKTVTCEHAEGEECTCTNAAMSGCPSSGEGEPGTCPGMTKTADSGGSCPAKTAGTCPRSAAAATESSTK